MRPRLTGDRQNNRVATAQKEKSVLSIDKWREDPEGDEAVSNRGKKDTTFVRGVSKKKTGGVGGHSGERRETACVLIRKGCDRTSMGTWGIVHKKAVEQ